MSHLTANGQFALPLAPQHPIPVLTAHLGTDRVLCNQHRFRRNIHAHRWL